MKNVLLGKKKVVAFVMLALMMTLMSVTAFAGNFTDRTETFVSSQTYQNSSENVVDRQETYVDGTVYVQETVLVVTESRRVDTYRIDENSYSYGENGELISWQTNTYYEDREAGGSYDERYYTRYYSY